MTDRIDADELLAEATARHAGGGGFDPASDEPFRIICRGLETTANLTHDGRVFTRGFLRRLLDGHLAIDAAFRADPTLADEVIEAPIFVIGAPRTGTTALHRLLASDPQSRVPEGWEFLYPTETDEPAIIDAAAEELGWEVVARDGDALAFYARDETGLFRFVDDVVVRVRPDGAGAKIDVRSKSRDGRGDMGTNAKRIRSLLGAIEG